VATGSYSSHINSDGNREKNCVGSLVHTRKASAREAMHIIALYSFLRRASGGRGAELLSLGSSNRTCGNGSKLCPGRFRLDIEKHFFTERAVKPWNRFPREVVDAQSLSVLKRHLDNALNNVL